MSGQLIIVMETEYVMPLECIDVWLLLREGRERKRREREGRGEVRGEGGERDKETERKEKGDKHVYTATPTFDLLYQPSEAAAPDLM